MFKNYLGGKYTLTRKKYTDAYPRPYIIGKIKELKPDHAIPFTKADKGYIAYKLYKIGKDMDMKIEGPEKKQETKERKQTEIKGPDIKVQNIEPIEQLSPIDAKYEDNKNEYTVVNDDMTEDIKNDDNALDIQYQDLHGDSNLPPVSYIPPEIKENIINLSNTELFNYIYYINVDNNYVLLDKKEKINILYKLHNEMFTRVQKLYFKDLANDYVINQLRNNENYTETDIQLFNELNEFFYKCAEGYYYNKRQIKEYTMMKQRIRSPDGHLSVSVPDENEKTARVLTYENLLKIFINTQHYANFDEDYFRFHKPPNVRELYYELDGTNINTYKPIIDKFTDLDRKFKIMPIKYKYYTMGQNGRNDRKHETNYFNGYEILFQHYNIEYKIQQMPFENNFGQRPNFLYLI